MKNIYAYTAPTGNYPPYISVNEDVLQSVSITVRGAGDHSGSQILLSREQVASLASRLNDYLMANLPVTK